MVIALLRSRVCAIEIRLRRVRFTSAIFVRLDIGECRAIGRRTWQPQRVSDERFDDLFASLEAQIAASVDRDLQADVDEVARATLAELSWTERLRGSGEVCELEVLGLGAVRGYVERVGKDVVELAGEDGHPWVVALEAVVTAVGLADLAIPASRPRDRLGLAAVLRDLARERAVVRLFRRSSTHLDGTIDRAGADFVDLAEHHRDEPRRPDSVRRICTVPISALAAVRVLG